MRKKRRNARTLQLNSGIQVQQRVIMNIRVACVSCCEAQAASVPRTLRLRLGQAPSTSLRAGFFENREGWGSHSWAMFWNNTGKVGQPVSRLTSSRLRGTRPCRSSCGRRLRLLSREDRFQSWDAHRSVRRTAACLRSRRVYPRPSLECFERC